MSGRAMRILGSIAALGVCVGGALAQETAPPVENLDKVFQRLQQQDRQAREDGFVLESFKVQQPPNDPRHKSMKLSFGKVGGKSSPGPFDEPQSNYLLAPQTPVEAPPVGLNLKLQF